MNAPSAPRPPWRQRLSDLPGSVRGLLWAAACGVLFSLLNALMRYFSLQMDPMQVQFLRYLFGLLVMLPLLLPTVLRQGSLAAWRPKQLGGQFTRGAVHTLGLVMWYAALPNIPLADMTAIGFTTPIFIMLGAWWVLREPMRWERWAATALGFVGVLVVVAPRFGGNGGAYHLLMLASAPVFAASFLITKVLTRSETAGVIVLWQAISVTLFSLPLAWWTWQQPTAWQWAGFVASGVLGSAGHYCLTRSFVSADISATQSAKFLELMWSAGLGWLIFADVPTQTTLIGGVLICSATLWVARREHLRSSLRVSQSP